MKHSISIPNILHAGRTLLGLLPLLSVLLLAACSDEAAAPTPATDDDADAQTLHVTIICSNEEMDDWEHTVAWAAENIKAAQKGMERPVRFAFTFKCQEDADFADYVTALAKDSTVDAVVGPTTTETASIAASAFSKSKTKKPLISPNATGISYQRIYSSMHNVWNMSECDIAEIEAFMANIRSTDLTLKVSLVVKDGEQNGEEPDFAQWFGFLATEYGLSVEGIYSYEDEDDLADIADYMISTEWKSGEVAVLFVPTSYAIAKRLDEVADSIRSTISKEIQMFYPDIYCTDAFVSDSVRENIKTPIYQGFDLSADPYTGFALAHEARFKEEVQSGEPHLYDALTFLALAAKRLDEKGIGTLNDALEDLAASEDDIAGGDWSENGLRTYFNAIADGRAPAIYGASGMLSFDVEGRSGRSGTYYRLWRLYDNEFNTLGYFSDEESRRAFSTSGATWNQTGTVLDSLEEGETHYPTYGERGENWAFLIAASPQWSNYRFQADVFSMYQILMDYGYDDDHIVLICEDDIAYDARNPEPGVLRTSPTSDNVYDANAIDYHLSDLTPSDIADILAGRKSDRLPNVISATENDNVFVFWSGHGNEANAATGQPSFCKYGRDGRITHTALRDMLAAVPHRKMMVAIESCFSGILGEECEGIPGLLVLTAANATETSVPDNWDNDLQTFRSNGFTLGFQSALRTNPFVNLRDLYYTLARSTYGSHVKVYNSAYYGNIYTETMDEFLVP